MSLQQRVTASALAIGIVVSAGCGSDRSMLNTAPSATAATAFADQPLVSAESTPLIIASVVTGTSCPTLQFRISTYLFRTDAATAYEGGSCANLQVGTRLTTINVTTTSSADTAAYVTRIGFASSTSPAPAPTPAPTSATVTTDGTVTSLVANTACPNLEFMFGAYLFKITPATAYSQASCTDVKVGAHVYVAGTKRDAADPFVTVTGLGVKRDGTPNPTPGPTTTPPPTPAPEPASFEATVTVSSLLATSACPYREFMVGEYRLTTSALTRYEGGRCADIAAGATLSIVATKGNGDTSVLVSSITFKSDGAAPPAGDTVLAAQTVDSLVSGTSCPALSFRVGPYTVTANAATVFEGGMCADIKAGTALYLTAVKQSDDQVLATRVSFPD